MKYSEAGIGRVFTLRLEQGESVHKVIESFAREKSLSRGVVWAIGGADCKSELVTGPEDGADIKPGMALFSYILDGVHESAGVGTIFPDNSGDPILHLHLSCGRGDRSVTGCARNGVLVWLYMEVVIMELTGLTSIRSVDSATGFKFLIP